MAGFMMQKGIMIVCGDAADGVADSMYAGTVYVGGKAGDLGADAVDEEFTADDREPASSASSTAGRSPPRPRFRKLVAGRKLWNFHRDDLETWKAALSTRRVTLTPRGRR